MKFTFNKYGIPYPFLDDPANVLNSLKAADIFIPDQLLGVMEETVRPLIAPYEQAYEHLIAANNTPPFIHNVANRDRIIIFDPRLSWDESAGLARETVYRLDPAMGQKFDEAVRNGWVESQPADEPGLSEGSCWRIEDDKDPKRDGRGASIRFTHDGTINDPVYLTHEAGHYIANQATRGSTWGAQPRILRITMEIQGFFFQHAFYDPTLHPDRSPELARAVALHKTAEALLVVRDMEREFAAMDQSRQVRGDDRFSEAGFSQLDGGYALHRDDHVPAYFVAAGLWERYKGMTAKQQRHFLSALYPAIGRHPATEGVPPLDEILQGAGIENEGDLRLLVENAAVTSLSSASRTFPRSVMSP
jgi:hypothetical protein